MKELSIEDKAKRYDEAIERAKSKIKNDNDHVLYEDDVIEIFPELKESEDERIRREIISALTYANYKGVYDKHIAWLEKQGEQKPVWSKVDEEIFGYALDMIEWYGGKNEDKTRLVSDWLKSLKDRVQSTQTWKPSEEQMEALDDFIYAKYPNIEKYGAVVKLLYQDLKKLMEE